MKYLRNKPFAVDGTANTFGVKGHHRWEASRRGLVSVISLHRFFNNHIPRSITTTTTTKKKTPQLTKSDQSNSISLARLFWKKKTQVPKVRFCWPKPPRSKVALMAPAPPRIWMASRIWLQSSAIGGRVPALSLQEFSQICPDRLTMLPLDCRLATVLGAHEKDSTLTEPPETETDLELTTLASSHLTSRKPSCQWVRPLSLDIFRHEPGWPAARLATTQAARVNNLVKDGIVNKAWMSEKKKKGSS